MLDMPGHHDGAPVAAQSGTVLMVFELSKSSWRIGVVRAGGQKMSRHALDGGDTAGLEGLIGRLRAEAPGVRIASAYEAGLDGFWLHRWLSARGVDNRVLDPASIQVNRRARRAKTDRLDLDVLMRTLAALERGEPRVCSVCRPPSAEHEDARRLTRERGRLVRERTAHITRLKALLLGQGVRGLEPLSRGFRDDLAQARTGDGAPLPPNLAAEIAREHERLGLVVRQIDQLEAEARAEVEAPEPAPLAAQAAQLTRLRGIGLISAGPLAREVFWRRFDNRRQVAAYFGLDGSPFNSGASRREQGISKAGNPRARTLAIELAWLWLRHQPNSDLSRWFVARVGEARGRVRRIAIAALARKLMVALWRYLETGVVPNGAVLRA
jgi:transposase